MRKLLITFVFIFVFTYPCHAYSLFHKTEDPAIFFYTLTSPSRFIVVDKKNQLLTLFEQRNGIKLVKKLTAATGKNEGNKKTRGDERTPEGIYFITKRHKDREISVFGKRAFHLNYPNVFDIIAGRRGDGIYIHGTNRILKPNSTNGCITLNNSDLEKLAPYLSVNDTPIIITDTIVDPDLDSAVEIKKDSQQFREILKTLSITPEIFPLDSIKNLFFIRNETQAIADIHYYKYEAQYTRYLMHKRVYLNPASTHDWPTIHTIEVKAGIPTLLAFHPKKISYKKENME